MQTASVLNLISDVIMNYFAQERPASAVFRAAQMAIHEELQAGMEEASAFHRASFPCESCVDLPEIVLQVIVLLESVWTNLISRGPHLSLLRAFL